MLTHGSSKKQFLNNSLRMATCLRPNWWMRLLTAKLTLRRYVIGAGAVVGSLLFAPIFSAGAAGCLDVQLALPVCDSEPLVATFQSCGNSVTQLTYQVNGKSPVIICTNNCGADTNVSFLSAR